jgi:hypothetical protein
MIGLIKVSFILILIFIINGCGGYQINPDSFISGIELVSPSGKKCAYQLTFSGGATGSDISIITISPPNIIDLYNYDWQPFKGYLYDWKSEDTLQTVEYFTSYPNKEDQYSLNSTTIVRSFDLSNQKYIVSASLNVLGTFSSLYFSKDIAYIEMKYGTLNNHESVIRFQRNIEILDSLRNLTTGKSGKFNYFVDDDSIYVKKTEKEITDFKFKSEIKSNMTQNRVLEVPVQNITLNITANRNINKIDVLIKEGPGNSVNHYILTSINTIPELIIANESIKEWISEAKFKSIYKSN